MRFISASSKQNGLEQFRGAPGALFTLRNRGLFVARLAVLIGRSQCLPIAENNVNAF
jgi:hypothetical protein